MQQKFKFRLMFATQSAHLLWGTGGDIAIRPSSFLSFTLPCFQLILLDKE